MPTLWLFGGIAPRHFDRQKETVPAGVAVYFRMPAPNGAETVVLALKPKHKPVVAYYAALAKFDKLGVKHEGAVSSAFEDLLEHCARQSGRVLIPKYTLRRKTGPTIIPDAAIVDSMSRILCYGFWEAKDTDDDL